MRRNVRPRRSIDARARTLHAMLPAGTLAQLGFNFARCGSVIAPESAQNTIAFAFVAAPFVFASSTIEVPEGWDEV